MDREVTEREVTEREAMVDLVLMEATLIVITLHFITILTTHLHHHMGDFIIQQIPCMVLVVGMDWFLVAKNK